MSQPNKYTFQMSNGIQLKSADAIVNALAEIAATNPLCRYHINETKSNGSTIGVYEIVPTTFGGISSSEVILRLNPSSNVNKGLKVMNVAPMTDALTSQNLQHAWTEFVNHMKLNKIDYSALVEDAFDTKDTFCAQYVDKEIRKSLNLSVDDKITEEMREKKIKDIARGNTEFAEKARNTYLTQNAAGKFTFHTYENKSFKQSERTQRVLLHGENQESDVYTFSIFTVTKSGKESKAAPNVFYRKERDSRILYISSEQQSERSKKAAEETRKKNQMSKALSQNKDLVIVSAAHRTGDRSQALAKSKAERELKNDKLRSEIMREGESKYKHFFMGGGSLEKASGAMLERIHERVFPERYTNSAAAETA